MTWFLHLLQNDYHNKVSEWMKTKMLLFFQLVTQCNAKYVECFSAQKECNKEKNRNSSVVPCKILKSVWLDSVLVFFHWILCIM